MDGGGGGGGGEKTQGETQYRHCTTQLAWQAKLSPFSLLQSSKETSQLQKQSAGAVNHEGGARERQR